MTQLEKSKMLPVYLPDTRNVVIAGYGKGNHKIGEGVFTYSRVAGKNGGGTCPGSTDECEAICYAKRIGGIVRLVHEGNSVTPTVPPIPAECRILRVHVSGDFDSVVYIDNWIERLLERPDVTMWAYTRSWRVPHLLSALERLRALPNVQLFASMDQSHEDVPPAGWRRAWIDGDTRAGHTINVQAHVADPVVRNQTTFDGTASLVCPEETGHKRDCVECGYCFKGQARDVTFLRH